MELNTTATQIYDEAVAILRALEDMDLPDVETQDFRAGLELIADKAKELGADA